MIGFVAGNGISLVIGKNELADEKIETKLEYLRMGRTRCRQLSCRMSGIELSLIA